MEMQSVIADQYIVRRKKPVRIVTRPEIVRHPWNMPFQRPAAQRPAAQRPAEHLAGKERGRTKRKSAWSGIQTLVRKILPGYMPVAAAAAVMALLSLVMVAAGSFEQRANLRGFVLPADTIIASILLDSVSPPEQAPADESLPPALPYTLSLSSYTVKKNETIDAIAKRFGVRLDTLISVNGIKDVRRIGAGSTLKIPNIDGVMQTIRKGDSLSAIASARGVSLLDIIDANDLGSQTIVPGQSLFIPGARLSSYELKQALGKLVMWPIRGEISSYFGYRANPFTGIRQFHNGLDIVGPENMVIKAAMDGRVAETGYSTLFGNFVIIAHPDNYQTLYAHLNAIKVKTGSTIAQGDPVGLLGSTGYSTGPHLHFGVFKRGVAVDPLRMLNGK